MAAPNDTDINKPDKNDTDRSETELETMAEENKKILAYGRFENVFLSEKEFESLKKDFPDSWMYWIDRLSGYMASTQKTYRNHFATICLWAQKEERDHPVRNYEKAEGLIL